jgi:hypothetical protein
MSCTGQVLTMIVDHRERLLALMKTRDAVVVRHSGLRCLPSEGLVAARIGERRLVTQALYGEVSKPTRIGHSIRHKV